MSNHIDPLFTVTLQKAIQKGLDASARSDLTPGVHKDIDMTLQVHVGEVRVAPDTDKTPTCSIPMLAAMALLVKRMGFQREKSLEVLRDVMKEALTLDKDSSKMILEQTGVAEAEAMIREEVINQLPRTPVKGSVTVSDVEVTFKSLAVGSIG